MRQRATRTPSQCTPAPPSALAAWIGLGLGVIVGCAGARPVSESRVQRSATQAAPAPAPDVDECAADLGAPDRRLTRFELAHAVEDVFAIDASALRGLPAPVASIGDVPDILVGRLLDTSKHFLDPYRQALPALARAAAQRLAASCSGSEYNGQKPGDEERLRDCVVEQLRVPMTRLWRASPSTEERAALGTAVGVTSSPDPVSLFERGITYLLDSPRFYLLANEARAGERDASDAQRFAARRLASRLALVLWSSVPDQALLEHAERGDLDDDGKYEAELRRMHADARFARFAQEFSRQWLRLDRRPLFRPSLESRTLVEDSGRLERAHDDVARFVSRQLAADRPVTELLTASDAELNPSAPASLGRAGLLTSRAVLSAISTPIRGGGDENWLGRGLVVQSAFLCHSFPLAAVYPTWLWEGHALLNPRLTAENPRPPEPALLSIRTHDKPCRECHSQLETLGATLAQFDGFGEPSALTASVTQQVPGDSIAGPSGLASWILRSGRFEPCVAQKLSSYVLSRAVLPAARPADRCLVHKLTAKSEQDPNTLKRWLWTNLTSQAFRAQGKNVIRDKPNPSPNSNEYTVALPPIALDSAACQTFNAGAFLVDNCGTAACHGPGSGTATFAVAKSETALRLLRTAKPSAEGYCGEFPGYLDAEQPLNSLVVRKLTSGDGSCGAAMPIVGGPRTLSPADHACFIRWVAESAETGR